MPQIQCICMRPAKNWCLSAHSERRIVLSTPALYYGPSSSNVPCFHELFCMPGPQSLQEDLFQIRTHSEVDSNHLILQKTPRSTRKSCWQGPEPCREICRG